MRTLLTIEDADREAWNRTVDPMNPHHAWDFLRAVENGKWESTQLRYLVFDDEQAGYGATAVLSAFETTLLGPRIRVAACGLPFPGGQYNFSIRPPMDATRIHKEIAQEIAKLGAETKAHLLLVKELGENQLVGTQSYLDRGFRLAPSLPFHRFEIKWRSFPHYLNALRCRYRRDVVAALRSIGQSAPELVSSEQYDPSDTQPRFVIGGQDACSAPEFYRLLSGVADRAKAKTFQNERPEFVEAVYQLEGLQMLTIKQAGRTLIAALLLKNADHLAGVFIGKGEQDYHSYHLYPNIIHGAIQLAIQSGCRSLSLGQTTDAPKIRRGSIPEKRYFLIRARNGVLNQLMRCFHQQIFPEPNIPTATVFRQDAAETGLVDP